MTYKARLSTSLLINVLFFAFGSTVSGLMAKGDLREKDIYFSLFGYFKPESFGATNATWLDNNNALDKIFYSRHTLDVTLDCEYGKQTYGEKVAELRISARNKALWGAPGATVYTVSTTIQELEAVGLSHSHAISLLLPWMRELWLELDLGTMFSIPFKNKHVLTLGAFSFELGRGIALGDAYSTGPGFLGFYTEDNVDQFAFGVKLGGDIIPEVLTYDIYTAFLQNRMFSFAVNAEKIFGQEFGRLKNAARGAGTMNLVGAVRLQWKVFNSPTCGSIKFEPYALFNHDPEQRVEFLGDASGKLATFGLAGEYKKQLFEGGFDCAMNLGVQRVKGWDRNEIQKANVNGQVVLINSHVLGVVGTNPDGSPVAVQLPYLPGGTGQTIIDNSARDQEYNGDIIGSVPSPYGFISSSAGQPIEIQNASNRFRNPYRNILDGWMFVVDGAYWAIPERLQLAIETGVASGGDNPNLDSVNGKYSGFIGLQEIYSGKRVKSAFVLGGSGKIKRPFSQPRPDQESRFKNASVSRFTNLVYLGTGLQWKENQMKVPFQFNPNVLIYWQEHPIGHVVDNLGVLRSARMYLGVEANVFFTCKLMKELEGFLVTSFFFPGTHFDDRTTFTIGQEEIDFLNRRDVTGFVSDRVPQLGNNIAYTVNIGLKYTF